MSSSRPLVTIINMPYPVYNFFEQLPVEEIPRFKRMLKNTADWPLGMEDGKLNDLTQTYISAMPDDEEHRSMAGTLAAAQRVHDLRVALDTLCAVYVLYRGYTAYFENTNIVLLSGHSTAVRLLALGGELIAGHAEETFYVPDNPTITARVSAYLDDNNLKYEECLPWLSDMLNGEMGDEIVAKWSPRQLSEWLRYARRIPNYRVVAVRYDGMELTLGLVLKE